MSSVALYFGDGAEDVIKIRFRNEDDGGGEVGGEDDDAGEAEGMEGYELGEALGEDYKR